MSDSLEQKPRRSPRDDFKIETRRMRHGGNGNNVIAQLTGDDRRFITAHRRAVLEWIVNAAVQLAHADMGNIQIYDRDAEGLRIAAQQGFDQPFLDYFALVHTRQSACGAALQTREPVVIEDVTDSAVFADAPTLEVMLDAGVRAVQSIPLIGSSGVVVGVLSVHYRAVPPSGVAGGLKLGIIADKAARWIERTMRITEKSS